MVPPESVLLSGSNSQEIISCYNRIISQLDPEIGQQLAAVMKKHLITLGPDALFERLNGRTVAQVIAEVPPDELQSLIRRRYRWDDVRETALTGAETAVEKQSCPKCGGALLVRFDPASPQPDGTTAGFLIIRCLECAAGCCADRVNGTPPWVEPHRLSIRTIGSQQSS
jgi:hypothetical protein